jgi:hypothetical protein
MALVVLGILLLLAGTARASCGQYVEVHGQHHPAAAPDPVPVKPAVPCHGPNCSQGPSRAPLAPVVVSSPTVERWAAAPAWLDLPEPTAAEPLDTPGPARGIHEASPPDPPPRLALS